MTILILLLLLVVPYSASAHSLFTNEPVASEKFFECDFTNDDLCGMDNHYGTQKFATPYAPYPGDPNARSLDNFLCATCIHANGSWGVRWPIRRSVFLGMIWAPDLEGYSHSSNKVIFLRNGISDNSLLVCQGLPNQICAMKWHMQGLVNNQHIPSAYGMTYPVDGTGWFNPTEANSFVPSGSGFHKVEVCLTASTTRTSRDGIISLYVDGKRSTNITNANIAPEGLNEFQVNSTWDGQDTAKCKGDGKGTRTCPREWHHYFSKVYLSNPVQGCTGDVSGGGVVIPVPPVIPPVPGSVTNVTVTVK